MTHEDDASRIGRIMGKGPASRVSFIVERGFPTSLEMDGLREAGFDVYKIVRVPDKEYTWEIHVRRTGA